MSGGIARGRLAEERKSWRICSKARNRTRWICEFNELEVHYPWQGWDWEGGHYPVTLLFNENYPSKPPECKFPPGFLHPNVYSTGHICLSIIGYGWKPAITVRQILVGIQELLDHPNPASPANHEMNQLLVKGRDEYKRRMQLQAKQYPPLI